MTSKTTTPKPKDIERSWFLLDAQDQKLGRLASQAAKHLIAKYKKNFSYHFDNGDFVVVINAAQIAVSGNKLTNKKYYRHSGYTGNLKEASLGELMAQDPCEVIKSAVKGMLPQNKLGRQMLTRLRVFQDDKHPYARQLS